MLYMDIWWCIGVYGDEKRYMVMYRGEWYYCCGATEGSEQQHNQELKEIYKGRRILEFITFYHNALHLTRVHCAKNNSNKNTGKFGESASFAAQT